MDRLDLYTAQFAPGIHLIEASAGTGKTYSIAQIVVRFVVEQGISVEEIGVVTFTNAATAELRQRIQTRLIEAREAVRGDGRGEDRALTAWAAGLKDPEAAKSQLEAELLKLDLMPIQTIHSFCHQLLRQQALEAGERLAQTLLEEEDAFNQAIVDDFWRRQMATLSAREWRQILSEIPTPDALYAILKDWPPPVRFVPELSQEAWDTRLAANRWRAFASWMDELCGSEILNQEARRWWAQLSQEEGLPERLPELGFKPDLLEFLASQINARKLKAKELERLPQFSCHREVLEALAELGRRQRRNQIAWLQDAHRAWVEEYERRLREQGWITHDFALRRLAKVLAESPQSPALWALKRRFKVVLIDEFQDTDRHQWQIFASLFGDGEHWLFLIGDPKQSIYAWRGADLSVYFKACEAATHFWQLGTNYRSHPQLVAAINDLFGAVKDPQGPFLDPRLVYHPVEAGCSAAEWALLLEGQEVPPLVWCAFYERGAPYRYSSQEQAVDRLARQAAADIACLLQSHRLRENGELRPIRPADIAVLVRDNNTARRVRDVLREFAIPAVLIDRGSVWNTDTAKKLYRLCEALLEAGDWRRIKRVLADGWFGLDARDLATWEEGGGQAEELLTAFAEAGELWWRESLLVAVEELFARFAVWQHIAASRSGKRTLADLRHLLEMLQETASRNRLSPQALLTWYRRRLVHPPREDEQLRLESDEEAVELVTMHSAKGLEYPIVLVFDLWLPEKRLSAKPPWVQVQTLEALEVVFELAPEVFAQAKNTCRLEARREALRLAYVALTRAKANLRVYLLEKAAKEALWSPLAHLLTACTGQKDLYGSAQALAATHPERFRYERRELAENVSVRLNLALDKEELVEPEPLPRAPVASRVLTSYSALVRGQLREASEGWLARLLEEGEEETPSVLKGAAFGTLLHGLLERYPFGALLKGEVDLSGLPEEVDRAELLSLIARALTTPVPEFALKDIPPQLQLKELEFLLPVRGLNASLFNRLCAGQTWFRPLEFPTVHGFLQGFIDLVVAHRGRFYVIDYKSNELEDYRPEGLARAMRDHDYGLQALLYALAVHRYLKRRLPDYRYADHFGGVRYLFVRGMDGQTPGSGVFGFRPEESWIAQLEGLLDGG
nr:exodeoxyribonuclease V beta subunit [uncultured Gammaproteobacteria bacterium]